jgi:hypothetical protein
MAKLAVAGPFDERDSDGDPGRDPVGPEARESFRFREGRLLDLQRVEPRPQVEQHLRVEARPDLPRERELALVVMTDEQRAEADPRALRIGEAADEEVVRQLASS